MAQPEAKVKAAITKAVEEILPGSFEVMVVPGGFGKGGIPDHLICSPVTVTQEMVGEVYGMYIAIEAKTEKGSLRGLQRIRIGEIIAAGGAAYVVAGVARVSTLVETLRARFWLK